MFQVRDADQRHIVHIDPISHAAKIVTHTGPDHQPEDLISDVKNIQLDSNAMALASESVPAILDAAGIESDSHASPHGWIKLNFIAEVDGTPARVTYVLKDGHIDVSKFDGSHGMSPRHFFLRLHTSHGQPPHWNARMIWTFFLDAMAIAMVGWGITGLIMWWQIKRTRRIGGIVMAVSALTAVAMYLAMHDFYAATKL